MSEGLIKKIEAGEFSREKLENLYSNAERLGETDIRIAAKDALKEQDSRFYSRRFIKPIKDKVQEIIQGVADANNWANWEGNKVDNGIKPGGPMLKGEELAEYYISYRSPSWKKAIYLAAFQHDEESSVMYKFRSQSGEQVIVETSKEAVDLFAEEMK